MLLGITLDSSSSRDLDDALWATDEGDCLRLWISIAAVARAVKPASPLFQEALVWLESRYRGSQCIRSMLSHHFTEEHSLLPDRHRFVLALELAIAPSGRILESSFQMDTFISRGRIDYDRADRILLGKEQSDYAPQLHLLARAASYLDKGRSGLWGRTLDGEFKDDLGQAVSGTRQLVASTAIAYNAIAAETLARARMQGLYRVQDVSDIPDYDRIPPDVRADPRRLAPSISHCLPRAKHRSRVAPHWALQLPGYARSSSPLRRVEDLINQHQLLAAIAERPSCFSKTLLDGLCERLGDRAIAKDAQHSARQTEQRQTQLQNAAAAKTMTANQFAGLLERAAIADDVRPELIEAIAQRIADEKLTAKHAAVILSQPFARSIRQQVLEAVARESSVLNAMTVFNALEQMGVGVVKLTCQERSNDWKCRGLWQSYEARGEGKSKSEARSRAAQELLRAWSERSP